MDDRETTDRIGGNSDRVGRARSSSPSSHNLLFGLAVVALLSPIGCGVWSAYQATQAEFNLHSTLYMTCLVDHFVRERGRWPESWRELEAMPYDSQYPASVDRGTHVIQIGGPMRFDWPEQSEELQRRVAIDFSLSEEDVIASKVVGFQPIRPIGNYYPYWKYGFIEELQESLRNALGAGSSE